MACPLTGRCLHARGGAFVRPAASGPVPLDAGRRFRLPAVSAFPTPGGVVVFPRPVPSWRGAALSPPRGQRLPDAGRRLRLPAVSAFLASVAGRRHVRSGGFAGASVLPSGSVMLDARRPAAPALSQGAVGPEALSLQVRRRSECAAGPGAPPLRARRRTACTVAPGTPPVGYAVSPGAVPVWVRVRVLLWRQSSHAIGAGEVTVPSALSARVRRQYRDTMSAAAVPVWRRGWDGRVSGRSQPVRAGGGGRHRTGSRRSPAHVLLAPSPVAHVRGPDVIRPAGAWWSGCHAGVRGGGSSRFLVSLLFRVMVPPAATKWDGAVGARAAAVGGVGDARCVRGRSARCAAARRVLPCCRGRRSDGVGVPAGR